MKRLFGAVLGTLNSNLLGGSASLVDQNLKSKSVNSLSPSLEQVMQVLQCVRSPTLFNQSKPIGAKQLSVIDPCFSDHRAFMVGDTLVLNMMMQKKKRIEKKTGKPTYNNAFNQEETDPEYQERIKHEMSVIVHILRNKPQINKIALQEAPIKQQDVDIMADYFEKFLPQWNFAHYDTTDFSVTSIIRNDSQQPRFYTDPMLNYGKYDDRCLTFTNGNNYKWSNIHAKHGEAETCMAHIFGEMIDDMLKGKITRHDISGDFNASAEVINAVITKIWNEKCNALKLKSPQQQPYLLEPVFVPSPKGHQKSNGSVIDADGVLTLQIKPAEQYGFKFETRKLGLFAALFGSALLVDSTFADEAALAMFVEKVVSCA